MDDGKVNAHTVIPAQPGYYLLTKVHDENNLFSVHKSPIVAWIITYQHKYNEFVYYPDAVPVSYDAEYGGPLYILEPNGQVVSPADESWDTLEDFVAELNNRE